MVRHWIDSACQVLDDQAYGDMPTLHAHSQLVELLFKALETAETKNVVELSNDGIMFAELFDIMERFRDVLARLRLDPELSTDDACLTLTMLARLSHNLQTNDRTWKRRRRSSILDDLTEADRGPRLDRRLWNAYYRTPWQWLLRMGQPAQMGSEPTINWQLQRLYEALCADSLPLVDTGTDAHDANDSLGDSSSSTGFGFEYAEPMSVKDRGELSLLYAETLARSVRQSVSMQMHLPEEAPRIDLETAVESLVGRADAELGAQVFRDLVLSFTLPRGVVGLRHTLLLSRNTSTIATNKHGDLVGHAHGAALQGPSRVWQHGVLGAVPILGEGAGEAPGERNAEFLHTAERLHSEAEERERQRLNNQDCVAAAEMERGCVLLAGLAMLFAPSSAEARKGLAYQGRVRLPFFSVPLERTEPKSSVELMADGSWCYFQLEHARLVIKYRGFGLEALKVVCALLMLDASR